MSDPSGGQERFGRFKGQLMTKARLEAFSDGVFAVVATLLVLDVHLPETATHGSSGTHLLHGILSVLPRAFSYVLAFSFVLVFWVSHHQLLHRLKHADRGLLWLNGLFLLVLAFIPFPTGVLGQHPTNPAAVGLFGTVMAVVSATFSWLRHYALTTGDLHHQGQGMGSSEWMRSLVGPVAYSAATLAGFLYPPVSWGIFLFVPLFYMIAVRPSPPSA